MDLFTQFDNSEDIRISELLEKSEPYCQYGVGYNRNVADPANRLKRAISDGHGGKMLDWLADELENRLEYWSKRP